jgi:hypothetical protein
MKVTSNIILCRSSLYTFIENDCNSYRTKKIELTLRFSKKKKNFAVSIKSCKIWPKITCETKIKNHKSKT